MEKFFGNLVTEGPEMLKPVGVVTVGDHSYIPFSLARGQESLNAEERLGSIKKILNTLETFEKEHSNLVVTSWKFARSRNGVGALSGIEGIWIDHKPIK